jgi:hypothetical protein
LNKCRPPDTVAFLMLIFYFIDDANAHPAPDAAPVAAPETAPETAPRAAPDSAPDTAPQTAPETDYSDAGIAARKQALIDAIKKNVPDTKLTPDDLVPISV